MLDQAAPTDPTGACHGFERGASKPATTRQIVTGKAATGRDRVCEAGRTLIRVCNSRPQRLASAPAELDAATAALHFWLAEISKEDALAKALCAKSGPGHGRGCAVAGSVPLPVSAYPPRVLDL